MVILLAGPAGDPEGLRRGGRGVRRDAWQRFRYVTLPLLRPSLQVALIIRTILAFQVFAVVIALAGAQSAGAGRRGLPLVRRLRNPNVPPPTRC